MQKIYHFVGKIWRQMPSHFKFRFRRNQPKRRKKWFVKKLHEYELSLRVSFKKLIDKSDVCQTRLQSPDIIKAADSRLWSASVSTASTFSMISVRRVKHGSVISWHWWIRVESDQSVSAGNISDWNIFWGNICNTCQSVQLQTLIDSLMNWTRNILSNRIRLDTLPAPVASVQILNILILGSVPPVVVPIATLFFISLNQK